MLHGRRWKPGWAATDQQWGLQLLRTKTKRSRQVHPRQKVFTPDQGHTWSMRHLTAASGKGRGMLSSRRPKSCSQYSNTRKMLQSTGLSAGLQQSLALPADGPCMMLSNAARGACRSCKVKRPGQSLEQLQLKLSLLYAELLTGGRQSAQTTWDTLSPCCQAHLSGLLPVTTRLRLTRLGCLHCCSTRSSRIEVTGMPDTRRLLVITYHCSCWT